MIQSSVRDALASYHHLAVVALMVTVMISAVVVPRAFEERVLIFAASCQLSRLIITFRLAHRESLSAFRMDLAPSLIQGPLLLGGALMGGNGQLLLWVLAALWEVAGPLQHSRAISTQRYDVGNITERFSLLIIMAFGEIIMSIATPQTELEYLARADPGGLIAAFVTVGELRWAYLHHSLGLMEHYISRARVPFRAVRSLLAYGHLALVAGLIALAAGLHHVMEEPRDHVSIETSALPRGGVIVLPAMSAIIGLRNTHRVYRSRVATCALHLALIPVSSYLSGMFLASPPALITVTEYLWKTLAPAAAGVPNPGELTERAVQAQYWSFHPCLPTCSLVHAVVHATVLLEQVLDPDGPLYADGDTDRDGPILEHEGDDRLQEGRAGQWCAVVTPIDYSHAELG